MDKLTGVMGDGRRNKNEPTEVSEVAFSTNEKGRKADADVSDQVTYII